MKRTTTIIFLLALSMIASAKKVKFAVDLTGFEISANGVHVTGDFQTLAGFPGGDWASNTTPLTKEGSSDIYSRVVDIPAFQKYEYRFINGDQFYETEFVPVESRVGYDFNDNRWIYVDSIANDTTFVGAIVFGGNAPAGKLLIRFHVNMGNVSSIAPAGVHVAGSFQGWNSATIQLYSFVDHIYEIISYMTTGTYEYRFYNGSTPASAEIVPSACAVNTNRQVVATEDYLLNIVCFGYCVDCPAIGVENLQSNAEVRVYPNPATDFADIELPAIANLTISVFNLAGNEILTALSPMKSKHRIDLSSFKSGTYFLVLKHKDSATTKKLVKN
ncbi:MAG: T9SS type A sorting domain-containing protein [Bacteroidales bacterium]|nr:T9SS type A sorting domain-containing protein [Bacteroidales bacterium]